VLFRQGDPATAFFIMIDGWVKLYRITLSGEETVIHILTKGDSFAEAVAFTGSRDPATAEAVSDARVVRIPADHVVRCIRESPDIALAMVASTSQHLHHLVQQVEQLKAQSGVQRVADFWSRSLRLITVLRDRATYDKILIADAASNPVAVSHLRKIAVHRVVVHASHAVSDVAAAGSLRTSGRRSQCLAATGQNRQRSFAHRRQELPRRTAPA
jgi:CRP-like cAMP-binding protein